jgi:hypothetical protein
MTSFPRDRVADNHQVHLQTLLGPPPLPMGGEKCETAETHWMDGNLFSFLKSIMKFPTFYILPLRI